MGLLNPQISVVVRCSCHRSNHHFLLIFFLDCGKPYLSLETDDKCFPNEEEVKSYSYFYQIGSGKAAQRKKFDSNRLDAEFRIEDNLSPLFVQVGPYIWMHGKRVIPLEIFTKHYLNILQVLHCFWIIISWSLSSLVKGKY